MRVVRSFFIAVSMYSKIPVPQFPWKEEDMKYIFCFFPWVGGVIGVCVWLWCRICGAVNTGNLCRTAVATAIPIFITGGIHVDGFMDTMDALNSYQPRERKLEILKDAHIGAFSVIMLAAWGLLYIGAFSEIQDDTVLKTVCGGFFLSRCLSGIGAVSFPMAKKDGMLYLFTDSSHKRIVKGALYLQSIVCMGFMVLWSPAAGLLTAAAALLCFGYYYRRCRKELGGITGDTAGYFVVVCEVSMTVTAAAVNTVINIL